MFRQMLKSKINKAIITNTKLEYNGSIGIDKTILTEGNIVPGEKVQVLNYITGDRFETYVIEEPSDSGKIILYGPAAKRGKKGEEVCILSYVFLNETEVNEFIPKILILDENNKIIKEKSEREINEDRTYGANGVSEHKF